MVTLAGCFSSMSRSPSSWSLFTSPSWRMRLLLLKFWKTVDQMLCLNISVETSVFFLVVYEQTVNLDDQVSPRTASGRLEGPPCHRSSLAWWSFSALCPERTAPCRSPACIHTGSSGSGAATWSYPKGRKKGSCESLTSCDESDFQTLRYPKNDVKMHWREQEEDPQIQMLMSFTSHLKKQTILTAWICRSFPQSPLNGFPKKKREKGGAEMKKQKVWLTSRLLYCLFRVVSLSWSTRQWQVT